MCKSAPSPSFSTLPTTARLDADMGRRHRCSDIDGFFVNSTDGPVVEAWGRQLRERLRIGSGREGLHVYTNLAHGDEGEVVWYTEEKLPRLKELKSRYDPHSLFSYYNPIASH